jgi:hypothetical protein
MYLDKLVKLLNFIVIILLLSACQNNIRTDIIPEDKMIQILVKVYFMDVHFQELNSRLKDSITNVKLNHILSENNISQNKFEKSIQYYFEDDFAYDRLQDEILKHITEKYSN